VLASWCLALITCDLQHYVMRNVMELELNIIEHYSEPYYRDTS